MRRSMARSAVPLRNARLCRGGCVGRQARRAGPTEIRPTGLRPAPPGGHGHATPRSICIGPWRDLGGRAVSQPVACWRQCVQPTPPLTRPGTRLCASSESGNARRRPPSVPQLRHFRLVERGVSCGQQALLGAMPTEPLERGTTLARAARMRAGPPTSDTQHDGPRVHRIVGFAFGQRGQQRVRSTRSGTPE